MRKVRARYNTMFEGFEYEEEVKFSVEIARENGEEIKEEIKAKSVNEAYEMMVEKYNLFDDEDCFIVEAEEIEVVRDFCVE